ncbi:plasma membrane SNARE protein [Colletotrichum sojae]|uniref:Plasma membrane SNARE protein n=1 Tax=Colletotrichum sojae TaxID=2175907 RepID=A0A8H6IUF3_9PEZI|nr:plasma membrane SNARE protein [Colletotrichum sojae]
MKKFGFGKKSDDGDDANRSALFGRKNKSPAPGSDNPYAQAPGNDPYAAPDANKYVTPYQQARAGMAAGGPPGGLPSGPRAGGGYGAAPQPAGGYGNDKYGAAGGYGANRYDNQNQNQNAYGANQYNSGGGAGARGPGGYGGLGRTNSNDTDAQRDELFGGAQDRYQQRQQQPGGYGQSGAPGADGGYGGYGEQRELTAEEQEAEEYRATKNQIKDVRNESVQTVNRALQAAMQAEETGRATLARLGAQGERLHNTEKNLDLASNHNKVAQDRAKELKTLNRSMFAVHVSNPFTSKQRAAARDQAVLDRHRQERETREDTRNAAFKSNQRMEEAFKEMSLSGRPRPGPGVRSQAERSKYTLEGDSDEEGAAEAEAQERQIEDGLDQLGAAVGRLNFVARAQMNEVDSQNKRIDKIAQKSDAVDDEVRMNRERLNRIK